MTTSPAEIYRRPRLLTPALFIRLHVLHCSAKELANLLGSDRKRVSKWETIGVIPVRHRDRYRQLAAEKGRVIPEEWFETAPLPEVPLINDHAMP